MAKHKMTKEELQEDKLVEFMVLATKFIEDNMKKIISVFVVIIVLFVAGVMYSNYHDKMLDQANNILWEGDKKFEEKAYDEAINRYKEILSLNSVGTLKSIAQLKIANAYFAEKNYAEAKTAFETAQNALSDDFLKITAAEGIAQVLYAQGKFSEAGAKYEEIVNDIDVVQFKDKAAELTFAAAKSYEKGNDLEKAKNLYQNIVSMYEETGVKSDAEKKLEVLSYK